MRMALTDGGYTLGDFQGGNVPALSQMRGQARSLWLTEVPSLQQKRAGRDQLSVLLHVQQSLKLLILELHGETNEWWFIQSLVRQRPKPTHRPQKRHQENDQIS